jgi:hypothetical protein
MAKGATFRQAERQLGVPRTTLHRLAARHDLARRRSGLSPEKRRRLKQALVRCQSSHQVAAAAGVSRRTAWLHMVLGGLRRLQERSNTPIPCTPWRCPVGGELVNRTICIAHGTRKPPSVRKSPRRDK